MSMGFDPLAFDENDIDATKIVDAINGAADVSDELTGRILEAIGDSLKNVSQVEADLTQRAMQPVAEVLRRANETQNQLFGRIGEQLVGRVGSLNETLGMLEGQMRASGIDPELFTGPIAEDVRPFGGIRTEPPIAAGGAPPPIGTPLEEEPPTTDISPPLDIGFEEIKPPEEPFGPPTKPKPPQQPPQQPPTIQPPQPVFPPQPPPIFPPQPRPQTQPPTIVLPQPGVSCPPQPVQVVCPPSTTVIQTPPQGIEPETPPPGAGEEIPRGTPTDFCRINDYSPNNAVDPFGNTDIGDSPLMSFFFPGKLMVNVAREIAAETNSLARARSLNIAAWIRVTSKHVMFLWAEWFDRWWRSIKAVLGLEAGALSAILVWRGVLHIVGIFFRPAVAKVDQQLEYMSNALKPVNFPDQNEAVEAYVRGEINETTLRIWVEQNNYCWEPFKKIIDSRIDRIEPLMALQMFKRGLLTEEEFNEQIRKAGYTEDKLRDAYRGLEVFIPPITDLIRYMVRDVEDESIISKFGLDDEFESKWTGKSKEWGEQQGITDEVAKNYWRAHWRIPSPTQLFEMYHRSRHLADDSPLKTTIEDVRTALKQDDLLPAWIDRLINTTFRRLSRVDARRAYETGAISEEFLKNEFIKLGYEDDAIEALVNWSRINKMRTVSNLPEMKLYRDGLLDFDEARKRLEETKLDSRDMLKVLQLLEKQRNKKFFARCITAVRKRYLTGELTELETKDALQRAGLSSDGAREQFESFECERVAQGKHPSTSQLCQWLDEGTLSIDEFTKRLERIGWSREDAMRILVSCQRKISERRAREAERIANQQKAALEKAQREQQAALRANERRLQSALRAREKAERAKANREKLVQSAIAQFASVAGLGVDTAGGCIRGIERRLAAETLLTADERVQSIVIAVSKLKPTSCEVLVVLVDQLADQLLQYGLIDDAFLASLQ